jgi:tetratricopeptide (TPR) repeat protein
MKKVRYILLAMALPLFGMIHAQDQADSTKQGSDGAAADNGEKNPWVNPDFKSYVKAMDDLIKLGDTYAQNKLRLALANYQTGKSIIVKMRENVQRSREESEEQLRLNEKWYWQTLDRKTKEEKKLSQEKRTAKLKAVTYFTKAVFHLDDIDNPRVKESKQYKELLSNIYRDWAMAQYDLGNIPQIIDVLNRYIALDPEYEKLSEPHKYLASAYAFQEKIMANAGNETSDDYLKFKRLKNKHLLRATEIMYGKDTPEYNRVMEIVNKDEVIAITPP